MAVLAMKRITICGLRQNRKAVLEEIQRQGVVEVQNFAEDNEVFHKENMPIPSSEFERNIHDAENALEILDAYGPAKKGMLSSFKGRDLIEKSQYDSFHDTARQTYGIIKTILNKSKDITEKKSDIVRNRQQIDMLMPWKSLDIPLDTAETEKTAIFIGSVAGLHTFEELYEATARVEARDINIISSDKEQTCIVAVCGSKDKKVMFSQLRAIGFAYPSVSSKLTPMQAIESLNNEIASIEGEIRKLDEEILSLVGYRDEIRFYSDYMAIREEKYQVTRNIHQSQHTFVLQGYVPEKYIPKLKESLKGYDLSIEYDDPGEDEDVPVMLKNNAFSSSVQGVVESYALPAKGEIDPSFLISLFYFVFFGFMLADACIGLIIAAAAGILLLKNPHMEQSLRNNVKLFMFGGISAIFFGVLFGSYFGDLISSVSGNFFGHEIVVKPLWLDMTAHPMTVLSLALIMGIIHIFTGMGVAAYQYIKQKDYMSLVFGVIVWYVILIGLIIKCLSMQMIMDILGGGCEPIISAKAGNIGLMIAGVGAVVVIFMGEFKCKSWPKRLIKGAYAVYGITSYLSDVLSYSRLLALGLATGVISSVANMIGTMFGNGIFGVIIFIIVFVIINAINIGINTLGAYVHTNRLQYVEFFSRFYTGGGREFEPYSIKTKYYKYKEN